MKLPANSEARERLPRLDVGDDTAWMDRANCVGTDPEAWFPGKGGRVSGLQRQVCQNCEVRGECLLYALAYSLGGIWGGTTERERRLLKRERIRENTD
jgi:WhiB family redox-sensing transcriptional regulator